MWCREGLCCLWSIYLWALQCGAHENCWCVRGFVGFHGNREVAMFSILWLLVIEVLFNMFRIPGKWGLVCPRDMPTDPGSVWWNPCQEQGCCFHWGIKKPLDQMFFLFFLSASSIQPAFSGYIFCANTWGRQESSHFVRKAWKVNSCKALGWVLWLGWTEGLEVRGKGSEARWVSSQALLNWRSGQRLLYPRPFRSCESFQTCALKRCDRWIRGAWSSECPIQVVL